MNAVDKTMSRSRLPLAAVLLAAALSAGCGGGSVRVPADETYRGQFAAAIDPVASAGAPGIGPDQSRRIQSRLVRELERSDIFASVIPLSQRGESNEAEIIITPSVVGAVSRPDRFERIELRVTSRSKTTGTLGVNQVYGGRASGRGDALDDAVAALARDLQKRYGNRAVY